MSPAELQAALASERARRQNLSDELTEAESWAIVGLAADALLHELGNLLHRSVLQAALLERRVPEELRDDVQVIHTETAAAARLLAPLHQRRQERKEHEESADLNDCVRAALEEASLPSAQVQVSLASELPSIQCGRLELRRLLRLLLKLWEAGPAGDHPLQLRTQKETDGRPQVVVQFAGPGGLPRCCSNRSTCQAGRSAPKPGWRPWLSSACCETRRPPWNFPTSRIRQSE
jgi:C4-dicarboxylate-specific signal transduction histidine kinase